MEILLTEYEMFDIMVLTLHEIFYAMVFNCTVLFNIGINVPSGLMFLII